MAGKNKNICGKDLITDHYCTPGYEADFVIYLGSNYDVSAYMSRCRGQFVHICEDSDSDNSDSDDSDSDDSNSDNSNHSDIDDFVE